MAFLGTPLFGQSQKPTNYTWDEAQYQADHKQFVEVAKNQANQVNDGSLYGAAGFADYAWYTITPDHKITRLFQQVGAGLVEQSGVNAPDMPKGVVYGYNIPKDGAPWIFNAQPNGPDNNNDGVGYSFRTGPLAGYKNGADCGGGCTFLGGGYVKVYSRTGLCIYKCVSEGTFNSDGELTVKQPMNKAGELLPFYTYTLTQSANVWVTLFDKDGNVWIRDRVHTTFSLSIGPLAQKIFMPGDVMVGSGSLSTILDASR